MPRVKILAVDLDGTLLDSDREISPIHKDAVRRASEAGISVVLASGRNQTAVEHFAAELGLDGPMICANGAHVLLRRGVELAHYALPKPVQRSVIDFALASRTHLNLYSRERLYMLGDGPWASEYARRVRHVIPANSDPETLRGLEATKVMLVGEPDRIEEHRIELAARHSNRVSIVKSEPEYLEFLSARVDKGSGLRRVARAVGARRSETAAIGDYSNDVPMLRWAGLSAAMANASDDAKAAAKFVVGSNEDGGVAGFVDALLRDEEQ